MTKTILHEALELVEGARQNHYGHPYDDFGRVTAAARALGLDPTAGPRQHALYMILVKISRLIETPAHRDSLVDIPGYALTYEKCLEKEAHERV